MNAPRITTGLRLKVGAASVTLTPRQGLRLAEDLARKSFRRALAEEATRPVNTIANTTRKPVGR
jgi:hypothetical protein